jgi:oxygen-independent coproporphyrinogen-3 oxidase
MLGRSDNALGIYVSIPFCRSKCTYCNFASGVYPASEHERYVARVVEDLKDAGAWARRLSVELPKTVETVYLGGGTPGMLAPELLTRLFGAIRSAFYVAEGAEITVECAPGQLADAAMEALAAAGVNRISMGVQSFVDSEAAVSGRLHKRATVMEDLRRLRAAGIENIGVDLIAGLAGQTLASWQESLGELVDCAVPHASVYMLEVDEDSRLGREVLSHGVRYHAELVPSDDAIAQMYTEAIEMLGEAGLAQYEISNFCRAGFESRHNLRYWQRRPYLGVGLDASSALHEAGLSAGVRVLRTTRTSDLKAYLDGSELAETAWLGRKQQHEEAWFLGLRMNAGVDVASMKREFGQAGASRALAVVSRLAEAGLLSFDGATVGLTPRGRLLSNEVFQEFLDLTAETCEK